MGGIAAHTGVGVGHPVTDLKAFNIAPDFDDPPNRIDTRDKRRLGIVGVRLTGTQINIDKVNADGRVLKHQLVGLCGRHRYGARLKHFWAAEAGHEYGIGRLHITLEIFDLSGQ